MNQHASFPKPPKRLRLPPWLHRKLPKHDPFSSTTENVSSLHTVCHEAKCPNITQCFSQKTATFLVLGNHCTRACGFCEIGFSKTPPLPDAEEPIKLAHSVKNLGLKHAVITQVARDDLADGGATHIAQIIRSVRKVNPETTIEILSSDFEGKIESLDILLSEEPEVYNHNVETVRRLTPRVRHKATYDRSLSLLKHAKNSSGVVKTGLMVGCSEKPEEVLETLHDLNEIGVDIVTIGQYMKPSRHKLPVYEYVHPDQFAKYKKEGEKMGIKYVFSGPLVRSSFNAQEVLQQLNQRIRHG